MIAGHFDKELTPMFDDPPSDPQEVKSQSFEKKEPPGLRQGFPFHHRDEIIGDHVESNFSQCRDEPDLVRPFPCMSQRRGSRSICWIESRCVRFSSHRIGSLVDIGEQQLCFAGFG